MYGGMLTFQALANLSMIVALANYFRHDCGVNISCRPHVLQVDLFLKIYSSIWQSQNFLGYNSIQYMTRECRCEEKRTSEHERKRERSKSEFEA
jgi:hypothetical protein